MYKDEGLGLHDFLFRMMQFFEDNGAQEESFEEYLEQGIYPHHIHNTKDEHKYATLLLASGISSVLSKNTETVPKGITKKLDGLAKGGIEVGESLFLRFVIFFQNSLLPYQGTPFY